MQEVLPLKESLYGRNGVMVARECRQETQLWRVEKKKKEKRL